MLVIAVAATVVVVVAAVINNDNDNTLYANDTFAESDCRIVIPGDPFLKTYLCFSYSFINEYIIYKN